MSRQILKAVVAALTAAGALANVSADEVSLVQREVQRAGEVTTSKAEIEQTAMAIQTMLSRMHLEHTLRQEFQLEDGDAVDAGNDTVAPKCDAVDRQNIRDKLASLNESITIGKRVENNDYDAWKASNEADKMALAMGLPWQCKKAILNGISSLPWTLGPCTRAYFKVSKQCGWCAKDYLLNVIGYPDGCFADCLPLMTNCSSNPGGWGAQGCMDAATLCLQCGHPGWVDYSRCVYGSPNVEPLMATMDRIYKLLANGTIEVAPAIHWVRNIIRNNSGLPNGFDYNRSHPNYYNPNDPNARNLSDTVQGDELKTSEGPKSRRDLFQTTTEAPKKRCRMRHFLGGWFCHNRNDPKATNLSDTVQGDELKTSEGPTSRRDLFQTTTEAPKKRCGMRHLLGGWFCRD